MLFKKDNIYLFGSTPWLNKNVSDIIFTQVYQSKINNWISTLYEYGDYYLVLLYFSHNLYNYNVYSKTVFYELVM